MLPPTTLRLSGDPRRPYPQDIEMRSGWLGQLVEGFPVESGLALPEPALQEISQPSTAATTTTQGHPANGIGEVKVVLE